MYFAGRCSNTGPIFGHNGWASTGMSSGTKVENQRRESRYGIARGKTLRAQVSLPTAGDTALHYECHVLDLSRNGAKIQVDQSLPNQANLELTFVDDEHQIAFAARGTICWCRPADNEHWWIGCAFDTPLSIDILAQLAMGGYIDRRNDPRVPYDVAIRCRRQLNDEELDGTLVNVSVGGFAIQLERPTVIAEDERLLVELTEKAGTTSIVHGRVCWCGNSEDPKMVGCSFVSRDGYPLLRQSLDALKFSAEIRRRRRRPSVRTLLGLLAGVIVVAIGATILKLGIPSF